MYINITHILNPNAVTRHSRLTLKSLLQGNITQIYVRPGKINILNPVSAVGQYQWYRWRERRVATQRNKPWTHPADALRGAGRSRLCWFQQTRYSLAAETKRSCVTVINPTRRYLLSRRSGLLSAAFTARAVATVRRHDELHTAAQSGPPTVTRGADREHSWLKLPLS